MKTIAIVNPKSGNCRASSLLPRFLESPASKEQFILTRWTEYPGHAEIIAAQARREGFERVIIIGGDGTLFEVINGLWWESSGKIPSIGIIPMGTGCDYARNFDFGDTLTAQFSVALGESVIPVNIGVCSLQGLDGNSLKRVFANVLGIGFDANVAARFQQQRTKIPGKIGYILSVFRELANLKTYHIKGEINNIPFETDTFLFAVGLGRFFGGGMMITPNASIQAGSFQVVWGEYPGYFELMRLFAKLYTGKHISHPRVHTRYCRHLILNANPPANIEAEGELIGRTPIEIELYPAAMGVAAKIR